MTPDTIARLRRTIGGLHPNVRVKIEVGELNSLLDAAALVSTIGKPDTLTALKASAEICNGDLVVQRDAEIERADYALKAIATAALFLQTARENLERREALRQAPEFAGAPGA